MSENSIEIDYKAKYDEVVAERDALSAKLDEYIQSNNRLKADLKVSQQINRSTVSTAEPPADDIPKRKTLAERVSEYRKSLNE
jgi:hypothetical protein